MNEIQKLGYEESVRRAYPPFWSSLILSGITNKKYHEAFFDESYARKQPIVCDYVWYFQHQSEQEARDLIAKEWTHQNRWKKVVAEFQKREKILLSASNKDLKALSARFEEYMPALTLVQLGEDPLHAHVKAALEKNCSPSKADELLDGLNIPLKDNFYKKEELGLAAANDLAAHARAYKWLLSRYGSNTLYKTKDARAKRDQMNVARFLETYHTQKKTLQKTIFEAKKLVGPQNAFLIDALQWLIFYRTQRTDVMNKVAFMYIPKLTAIAKQHDLTYEQILFCTKDEIQQNKIPSKSIIAQRQLGHAMLANNGKIRCVVGREYNRVKKAFAQKIISVQAIRGVVASKGIVKGRVKIISGRSDFEQFKTGDILVTSMTTPEMIPIMKKAAAFVTNEGGITCHAAIVSREMHKPCIIGTKIATKVLKDGDLVEVNADTGEVRKLE